MEQGYAVPPVREREEMSRPSLTRAPPLSVPSRATATPI